MTGARPQAGPIAWCLLAAFLFGASTPAAKVLVPGVGALLLAGLLYLGAAVAVAPAAWRDSRAERVADRRNRVRLAGAVVLGGVIGPALLMWGLSLAPAGSVSLWLTLETVATAVLARCLFREHLGWRGWLATLLVVAASGALADGGASGPVAAGLVGLACVCWGLDNNLTARIDGFTTAQLTFVKGLVAGAAAAPVGWLLSPRPELSQILAALLVGALGYGASLAYYVAGAQQLGATRSQLWFSTAPLFGLAIAWGGLGEPLGLRHLIAAAAMGAALGLLSRESHRHTHRHDATEHTHWHRHDDGHHRHAHPEPAGLATWHQHRHAHERIVHDHVHGPDLHHRHPH